MTTELSQLLTFVSGAGGASVVMYLWIRSLRDQVQGLVKDLKEERNRNNAFGESLIELAAETKIHLETVSRPDNPLSILIQKQHEVTRTTISNEHIKTRDSILQSRKRPVDAKG